MPRRPPSPDPRLAPTPWVDHLRAHVALAARGEAESVHQVRVAAGRLGVWLRMARLRVLRDDLRWLRIQAAHVRELDVLLSSAPQGSEAIAVHRAQAQSELALALALPRVAALLFALSLLPPLDEHRVRKFMERTRRRITKRGAKLEDGDASIEDFHRMRREIRRLRYALEWTGAQDREVEELQGALGELNDAAVHLRLLESLPGTPPLGELRPKLEAEVERLRSRALSRWRSAQAKILEP